MLLTVLTATRSFFANSNLILGMALWVKADIPKNGGGLVGMAFNFDSFAEWVQFDDHVDVLWNLQTFSGYFPTWGTAKPWFPHHT